MAPREPSYHPTARPEYSNAAEGQENYLKNNFMNMLVVFKEEMKALLKEIKGKTSKNWQKPISPTKNVNKPRRKKQTGERNYSSSAN